MENEEYAQKIIEIDLNNNEKDALIIQMQTLFNEIHFMQKIQTLSSQQPKENCRVVNLKGISFIVTSNNILQVALFQQLMKSDMIKFVNSQEGQHWLAKKRILWQICESILFFQNNNLVHEDLKPENILVDKDNNSYLADFDTATIVRSTTQGKGGDIFGMTANYVAPEMLTDYQKYLESDFCGFGVKKSFWNLNSFQIVSSLNQKMSFIDYFIAQGGKIKSNLFQQLFLGCTQYKLKI